LRGSPAPFSDGRFWPLAPFWIPGSILDGQGSCQFFKILQVAIKGHLSLELVLYSRRVSMELGFSLYDALETMNSLGSDVTLTCLVVICLLLTLLVTALLNWGVGLSYRKVSPAYFYKPCNFEFAINSLAKLARRAVLSDGQPGVLLYALQVVRPARRTCNSEDRPATPRTGLAGFF
jgi:hypothetical protein